MCVCVCVCVCLCVLPTAAKHLHVQCLREAQPNTLYKLFTTRRAEKQRKTSYFLLLDVQKTKENELLFTITKSHLNRTRSLGLQGEDTYILAVTVMRYNMTFYTDSTDTLLLMYTHRGCRISDAHVYIQRRGAGRGAGGTRGRCKGRCPPHPPLIPPHPRAPVGLRHTWG